MLSALVIGLTALLVVVLMGWRGADDHVDKRMANGAATTHLWDHVLDQYGIPFSQFCITTVYSIYMNLTLLNLSIFAIKYLPTGVCMYKFVKNVYVTSRDRLKKKALEIEDLQLQITIMNTKLDVREAECAERVEALRRETARLREARARAREAIAADDSLGPALERWAEPADRRPGTDDKDMTELLKELKYERIMLAETQNEMLESGQPPESSEDSMYSSLSDIDGKSDCHVKIVKVTNVYKVAYLKHYIKQKRLRRASKQALLKKKMESIKKLLEEWQRSLSMVINNKLSLLERDTSDEAAGDHSKLRDSDSDAERSVDTCEDFGGWPSRHYYEEPDTAVSRSLYDSYEPQEYGDKYTAQCECSGPKGGHVLFLLPRLPEETSSQVAIAEIKNADDLDRDGGFLTV